MIAGGTTVVGRVYLRFATLPNVDTTLIQPGTAITLSFRQSDSSIYCQNGSGGSFGSSGVAVTTGVWYRIDFKYVGTGASPVLDAQVDGAPVAQLTGTGSSGSVTLALGLDDPVTADLFWDDLVVSVTGADYPFGAGYVNHFVPTADGTHNIAGTGDFQRTLTGTDILNATTTAFQLVDDVPHETTVTDWINMLAPPNATDYVECVFGPASGISTPTTAPRAVEVICGINQSGTGAGNMEIRLNDNGTMNAVYSATGVAGVAVATGQQFKRKHYASGPAGAWVIGGGGNGDFTDLRIRFGSPAALDVNPDQYFGCAMIEAEFAEVVVGRTTKNTRAFPLGTEVGMNWRGGLS